mmetsp:Transcript_39664/g.88765  ORF Transcript_39664/g.88765 Transcript_39664/m.88765 type:complete len:102 (+) Transcript_39664:635-940(+)
MTSDGPQPLHCLGSWGCEGQENAGETEKRFMLVLTRTFEVEKSKDLPKSSYKVTRVLEGLVEETLNGQPTLGGEVKVGDISVGFFKAIAMRGDRAPHVLVT